ncbi:cytochrome P450 [Irpex rosettiformis]|uniref:Cytochrome P450 n=1 Tax=Irpex rosettiformis TaxID=378272 RepID=A0ACB8TY42_9APHY|nr:cytochrome P450 [Irpex rosettiformis]
MPHYPTRSSLLNMTNRLVLAVSHVTVAGAINTLIIAALCTHFIFKKWEPMSIPTVTTLLLVLPMTLSGLLFSHFNTLTAVVCACLIFWTTLITSIVLYRLSPFHPLARYPGPIQAKISKLWTTWIVSQGRQHLYIEQLHLQYGDIVRIGPNELSIRDVSAIQALMGSTGWAKGPLWNGRTFHNPKPGLIALRSNAAHAAQRKAWNRAFNTTALKTYEPVIGRRVVQFASAIEAQNGTVDLAQWLSFFTHDFMCDMAFGGGTEMLRDGDVDGLWQGMKDGLEMSQVYETIPWASYYARYIPGMAMELKRFRAKCYQRAEQRLVAGSNVKDLLYYLSNEGSEAEETPLRSLAISEAVLAVIAGSDTTSSALSSTFWCLLRYPNYFKRLQEEVDRYYPSDDDALDPKHHPKMVFLDAVLKEVLRLYPAVPSGSQRSAEEGTKGKFIGPYYIPEGNQARIHFWSVQRDPRNFSDPESFYPDRWLIAEGLLPASKGFVHNPNAYVPFSFGPANCVGKNLALQEMRILICYTMQKLTMQFEEGWDPLEWERNLEDRMVYKTGRLPVIVGKRP